MLFRSPKEKGTKKDNETDDHEHEDESLANFDSSCSCLFRSFFIFVFFIRSLLSPATLGLRANNKDEKREPSVTTLDRLQRLAPFWFFHLCYQLEKALLAFNFPPA